MGTHRQITATASGLLVLVAWLSLSNSAPTYAAKGAIPQDVMVVNPAASAVPTLAQGTTQVAGTVSLAGTPTEVGFTLFASDNFGSYTVPEGQRLTIRSVSASCNVGVRFYRIQTISGGQPVQHYYPAAFIPSDSEMAAETLAFADGGTDVLFIPAGSGWTQCDLSFAGYLQPM